MTTKMTIDADAILNRAKPLLHQQALEIQPYGHLVRLPIALAESACRQSVDNLNQLLADTITLRDLYKKHHWQVAGPTFYQLHLLFDKHYEQQNETGRRDRRAHSAARRCQPCDGCRRRRDDAHSDGRRKDARKRRCRSRVSCMRTRSCSKKRGRWRGWLQSTATTAPTI